MRNVKKEIYNSSKGYTWLIFIIDFVIYDWISKLFDGGEHNSTNMYRAHTRMLTSISLTS